MQQFMAHMGTNTDAPLSGNYKNSYKNALVATTLILQIKCI